MVDHMTHFRRASWTAVLVLLHLLITPCATAMMLMPADMDCEHCQTGNSPDACVVASAATSLVIEGVAFDSGTADSPVHTAQSVLLLPVALSGRLSRAAATADWSRDLTTRHSGDPPLYLLLGQLRI